MLTSFIKPIIVIAMSETTKYAIFTLVGLLHLVRNDIVYLPLPSIPSRLWRESNNIIHFRVIRDYFPSLRLKSGVCCLMSITLYSCNYRGRHSGLPYIIPVKTGICSILSLPSRLMSVV